MAYTGQEQSELWDGWLNTRAIEDPGWTEGFMQDMIRRQHELGLIGPQLPIPIQETQLEIQGDS